MARSSSRRRRRDESDDGGDDAAARDSAASDGSPDTQKRRRLNVASGGSAPSPGGSLSRSMDGFHPGAILRVKVENFVTYEEAEFFPGPNLNMVIGPNGTGKSSLVCAICLGLGYSPKHLGRAGSVKEFVKHGKDTATIEIELQKRPEDRFNHVVRVQIRREQNSQKWWLNGKETTQKAVQRLMHSLKIQVDNLCQFLPQDRVVEFAACTPIDLLHETLRAAAPESMLQWQKQLQDLHKDKKDLKQAAHADFETRSNLESRQQGLQADVDRIREREEIQERVENLRSAHVLASYEEARAKYSEARKRKSEAERALQRLEEESGPSLEAVNLKMQYADSIEAAVKRKTKAMEDAGQATLASARDIATAADEVKEKSNALDAERKSFESKKKELAASRSKITAFQADLKNKPGDFNAADWNQKIRAEEHILRDLESEERQLTTQAGSVRAKQQAITHKITKVDDDIQALNTQEGKQVNFMRRVYPEVATAWEWVQEHQGEFEKEIFGPPMISCSVKNEGYSDQVQSMLHLDDFLCFTAQTKNDHKKLSDQLYRTLSLSVVIRTCTRPLEAFQPPVSKAETSALGLDGFALDYVAGPSPVLAMLCAEKRLHQSGVSLRDHGDAEYERLVKNGNVGQWVAGQHMYAVRRRKEYGPQAMTTVSKNIRPVRFWKTQPFDSEERDGLTRRRAELEGERDDLANQLAGLQSKRRAVEDQKHAVNERIDTLRSDKSALQKEYHKWQSLPGRIESEERVKATQEQAMRDVRQKILDLQYEWDDAALRRMKLVIEHKKLVDAVRDAHHALLEAKIQRIEARSDIQGLQKRNVGLLKRLEEEKRNVETAAKEAAMLKDQGKELKEKVKELISQHPETQQISTQLAEGKTPQEVELDIAAEEAKLELIHAANPNAVREYERRAQEIGRLNAKIQAFDEKLDGLDRQLAEIMGKWEPRLDELVSKINDAFAYNFEQISCAGEVRVHKDDDFSLWALDVMVKFRENEALQQLTAHRQSGGERAVSTIFYLMALQSMAQSPFRVVDEINQGMDPRNERMVHERMVEIACREHTSQYFLITPKLLTGLRYDPKMRVLCIASGEHMPREGGKLDFGRCLALQKSMMAAV